MRCISVCMYKCISDTFTPRVTGPDRNMISLMIRVVKFSPMNELAYAMLHFSFSHTLRLLKRLRPSTQGHTQGYKIDEQPIKLHKCHFSCTGDLGRYFLHLYFAYFSLIFCWLCAYVLLTFTFQFTLGFFFLHVNLDCDHVIKCCVVLRNMHHRSKI